MRIVHIITRLIRAGADENTMLTCLQQAADGHDVYLIHGEEFDPYFERLHRDKMAFIQVRELVRQVTISKDIKATFILMGLIRKIKPDVVHTHTSKAGILGRVAAAVLKMPAVIHGVHIVPFVNVDRRSRITYLTLERLIATTTHAFINVSNGTRDVFVEHRIGRKENHFVVHSGFDVQSYRGAQRPDDWRQMLGILSDGEKPPVILILAALTARKRHVQFLEVFRKIVDIIPDARLVLGGEGEQHAVIADKIRTLDLNGNVAMLGFRADPEKLVALADICVLPSEREGLPRVVMQYLAGAKPCVVSHLPGIEEVVVDDVNGVIVPSDDFAAMTRELIGLLQNRQHLARLTDGARRTNLDNWDAKYMWPKMKSIYARVLRSDTNLVDVPTRPTSDLAEGS